MRALGPEWRGLTGAAPEILAQLRAACPIALPPAYFDLLALSNGGEGDLAAAPHNFVLDPAEEMLDALRTGRHARFFAGFIVFGGNGGGEMIAFDARGPAPFPVVAIDMTNADLDESVVLIAADFERFLQLAGFETD